jgi:hypothetical protein
MMRDMFYGGTVIEELSSMLKSDPTGEGMRRCQRQLSEARDRNDASSEGAKTDKTMKALEAGITLLPVLWRDINRR